MKKTKRYKYRYPDYYYYYYYCCFRRENKYEYMIKRIGLQYWIYIVNKERVVEYLKGMEVIQNYWECINKIYNIIIELIMIKKIQYELESDLKIDIIKSINKKDHPLIPVKISYQDGDRAERLHIPKIFKQFTIYRYVVSLSLETLGAFQKFLYCIYNKTLQIHICITPTFKRFSIYLHVYKCEKNKDSFNNICANLEAAQAFLKLLFFQYRQINEPIFEMQTSMVFTNPVDIHNLLVVYTNQPDFYWNFHFNQNVVPILIGNKIITDKELYNDNIATQAALSAKLLAYNQKMEYPSVINITIIPTTPFHNTFEFIINQFFQDFKQLQ